MLDRKWTPTSAFRGEPDSEPLCWWFEPARKQADGSFSEATTTLDEALLGADGKIEGKGVLRRGLLLARHAGFAV